MYNESVEIKGPDESLRICSMMWICIQSNFNGSNIFGTVEKIVRDMGSSSHWGLIMVPGQEAIRDNLGIFFPSQ